MIEAIEPLMTALQSEAASLPAITADATAALSVGIAAFAAGYAEHGIGSAAMGAIAEDGDLFVNELVLTILPETLVILALVAIFMAQAPSLFPIMSLDNVAEDIRDEARVRAEDIRQDDQEQADEIITETKANAEELLESRKADVEQRFEREREQALSSARLETKQA